MHTGKAYTGVRGGGGGGGADAAVRGARRGGEALSEAGAVEVRDQRAVALSVGEALRLEGGGELVRRQRRAAALPALRLQLGPPAIHRAVALRAGCHRSVAWVKLL